MIRRCLSSPLLGLKLALLLIVWCPFLAEGQRRGANNHASAGGKVQTFIRPVPRSENLIEIALTNNLMRDACIDRISVTVRFSDRRNRSHHSKTFPFRGGPVAAGQTATDQFSYSYRRTPLARVSSLDYEVFNCSVRLTRLTRPKGRSFWNRLFHRKKHRKLATISENEINEDLLLRDSFRVHNVAITESVDLNPELPRTTSP